MSYTLTFHENLHLRASYSYPSSEHGGTGSVSINEPITITVVVDDVPFINSSNRCSVSLNDVSSKLLDAAQREESAKIAAAEKISNSIIGGFFGYAKADFSQTMVELENIVAAEGPKIISYLEQLKAIKDRMENDFSMLKKRYGDIFSSLDDELYREIHRLYGPCFDLIDNCFSKLIVSSSLDSLSEVFGYSELTITENALLLSFLKSKLRNTLESLSEICMKIRQLDKTLKITCNGKSIEKEETSYVPVVLFERKSLDEGKNEVTCFSSSEKLSASVAEHSDEVDSKEKPELMESRFFQMLSEEDERKRKIIISLWNSYKGEAV